jgi:hypothetical protein
MDYVDLTMQIDTAMEYQTFLQTQLLNSTGQPWGGFTWDIVSGPGAFFPNGSGDQNVDFTTSWPYDITDTQVFFHGAPFPSGSSTGLVPIVHFTVTEPGTVVLRLTPVGVPEPGSVILFAMGAVAIGFVRKWGGRRRGDWSPPSVTTGGALVPGGRGLCSAMWVCPGALRRLTQAERTPWRTNFPVARRRSEPDCDSRNANHDSRGWFAGNALHGGLAISFGWPRRSTRAA